MAKAADVYLTRASREGPVSSQPGIPQEVDQADAIAPAAGRRRAGSIATGSGTRRGSAAARRWLTHLQCLDLANLAEPKADQNRQFEEVTAYSSASAKPSHSSIARARRPKTLVCLASCRPVISPPRTGPLARRMDQLTRSGGPTPRCRSCRPRTPLAAAATGYVEELGLGSRPVRLTVIPAGR